MASISAVADRGGATSSVQVAPASRVTKTPLSVPANTVPSVV
jgi:hypothetical protein